MQANEIHFGFASLGIRRGWENSIAEVGLTGVIPLV
jgi:hypothetical protein